MENNDAIQKTIIRQKKN